MNRILLADSSIHAQRMGTQILSSEGFKVECAVDGDAAARLLSDFDPLVILADVLLPGTSGYDLCKLAKSASLPVAVLLTASAQATIDSDRAQAVGSDGSLSKPFEATALIHSVKRLAAFIAEERHRHLPDNTGAIDRERVEAAVTLAVEAALPALVREITERVLVALKK